MSTINMQIIQIPRSSLKDNKYSGKGKLLRAVEQD